MDANTILQGTDGAWLIGIGLIGFAFGIGAGFLLAWLVGGRNPQVKKLESELEETREALADYRSQVHKHFSRTSDLFQDVTERYRDLYDHLAHGNRDLCDNMEPAPLPDLPQHGRLEQADGTAVNKEEKPREAEPA